MYFQATGDMYTGFWKHDQMDGYVAASAARYVWALLFTVYDVSLLHCLRFGTYKYANGDVYEGQFHANARATPGLGTVSSVN
jgi:hypothetical protein